MQCSSACTLQNTLHLILQNVVTLCGLHYNKNMQTIIIQTKYDLIFKSSSFSFHWFHSFSLVVSKIQRERKAEVRSVYRKEHFCLPTTTKETFVASDNS